MTRGPDWEARHLLGWVIVGGQLLGTTPTLLVNPTVYSFFAHLASAQHGQDDAATVGVSS